MSNLMSMLYTGASGIFAAQAQVDITGHNIANINNANYSRQRVNLTSASVQSAQHGAFGRGVKIVEVERVYDDLLARTLRNEYSSLTYWTGSQQVMSEVRTYFNELESGSGLGLGEQLKSYFDAWSLVANTAPDNTEDSLIRRTELAETASTLAIKIRENREMYDRVTDDINERLQTYVTDINSMSASIATLNAQIAKIEASGLNANDLKDHRDALVNTMASIVGVNVVNRPNGMIAVYIAGQPVVDDQDSYLLEAKYNPDNGNNIDIYWNSGEWYDKGINITERLNSGTMQGEIKMRDEVIKGYISDLDDLARALISETNKAHVGGQGLIRFNQLTSSNTVPNPEYTLQSQYGNLPYTITNGTFQILVYDDDQVVDTIDVKVDPNTDTLHGIAEKITTAAGNSGKLEAYVDSDGALRMRTSDNTYTFAFGADTSNFLVAAGFNNFWSGTDSSNINLDTHISDNVKYIAAASDYGGEGNNVTAIDKIIAVKSSKLECGISIEEFYAYYTGKISTDKQQVDILVTTKKSTVAAYEAKMAEISGVSMEEEQINMVLFQRVLEANSRFVNAVDEMLNLIVNNLGLVGR